MPLNERDRTLDELKRFVEDDAQLQQDWRDKHDREALAFRTEIMEKIRPFEEFSNGLSTFWKILLGISALIVSCFKAWEWIKEHVK